MEPQPERWPKGYVIANCVAVAISLLAACVDLAIGPRNGVMWLVPLFQFAYASGVLLVLEALRRPLPDDFASSFRWNRWIMGEKHFAAWTQSAARNREHVRLAFLWGTPIFFLFFSVGCLFAALFRAIARQ